MLRRSLCLLALATAVGTVPISTLEAQDELFLSYECDSAKSCAREPVDCPSTIECESVFTATPVNRDGSSTNVEMYAVTQVESDRAYLAVTIRDPVRLCFFLFRHEQRHFTAKYCVFCRPRRSHS